MSEETARKIFLLALAAGAVLSGISLLVIAIHLGGKLATGAVLETFNIVFILLILAACATILLFAFKYALAMYSDIINRLALLERMHAELIKKLKKRASPFVSTTAIIASLVLLLSDKSFDGHKIATICIGTILIVAFWIANELIASAESGFKKLVGIILFVCAVTSLPGAIIYEHAGNIERVINDLFSLGAVTICVVGVAFLLAIVAPMLMKEN